LLIILLDIRFPIIFKRRQLPIVLQLVLELRQPFEDCLSFFSLGFIVADYDGAVDVVDRSCLD